MCWEDEGTDELEEEGEQVDGGEEKAASGDEDGTGSGGGGDDEDDPADDPEENTGVDLKLLLGGKRGWHVLACLVGPEPYAQTLNR